MKSRFSHQANQTVNCTCPPGSKCNCGDKPITVKDIYSRGFGASANWEWTDPDLEDD